MVDQVRFAFTEVNPQLGVLSTLPYLPLVLTYQNQSLNVSGLLDTGSSVNVLPYEIGLRLGAVWERQRLSVPLGGNLARFEARALVLTANVEQFPPVELAFAWTRDRNAPLILGHMNFFLAFNVCFYRAELAFEISSKKDELVSYPRTRGRRFCAARVCCDIANWRRWGISLHKNRTYSLTKY